MKYFLQDVIKTSASTLIFEAAYLGK